MVRGTSVNSIGRWTPIFTSPPPLPNLGYMIILLESSLKNNSYFSRPMLLRAPHDTPGQMEGMKLPL